MRKLYMLFEQWWFRVLYFGCNPEHFMGGVRVGWDYYLPRLCRVKVINPNTGIRYISHWQFYKLCRYIKVLEARQNAC